MAVCCALLLAAGAPAWGFEIADNFDNNRKNRAIWGKDDLVRAGAVTEVRKRLEYTVRRPTNQWDYAGRPLAWGEAPHDADWSVQMDVLNAVTIARAGQYGAYGLSIHKCGDWKSELYFEIYAADLPVWRGVYARLWANDVDSGEADTQDLTGTTPLEALLSLSYDSLTKVVTAAYDDGGAHAGSATFDLSGGEGGLNGSGDWAMAGSDRFCIQPYGYSEKIRVAAGKLFGDNFAAAGLVPRKILLLSPNGGEVIPSGQNTYQIQWFNPDGVDHVRLKYTCNRGRTWRAINPPPAAGDSTYDWVVPTPRANQAACLVKVTAFSAANKVLGRDSSDKPFGIEVVRLTAPDGGGASLDSGAPYEITWFNNATAAQVDHVLLFYSLDSGRNWRRIDTSGDPGNDGSFLWTPSVRAQKTRCKIKVVLKDSRNRTLGVDASNAVFTIDPAP